LRISAIVTEADLAAYDALRNGQAHTLEAESIVGIGEALIKARIMRNRGTTLLTTTYVPAERAQAQAINDMTIFVVGLCGSFAAGGLLEAFGWERMNLVLLPWLALAALALAWLGLRQQARLQQQE